MLHREVPDPRGWVRLDPDRTNTARRTVPAYPFDPPAASEVPERLYRLDAGTAVTALAVMAEEWSSGAVPVSAPELAEFRPVLVGPHAMGSLPLGLPGAGRIE